jgi:phosphoribosylcarboxyaminoimidazole (NCAIR) mutase
MSKTIRFILGSLETDAKHANKVLEILNQLGVEYEVSAASYHGHAGAGFEHFVDHEISEDIIVFIGGLELAGPGAIEAISKNAGLVERIVFGIPTDHIARNSIEGLPRGTAVITCGYNEVSLKHTLVNSALAIARLVAFSGDEKVTDKLKAWYLNAKREKPLIKCIALDSRGLLPEPEKKKE